MYVIDASVYVSRLQATETHHTSSKRLLEVLRMQRIPVSCPTLLWPEVAAALGRGTRDPSLARAAVISLRRLSHHRYVPLDHRLAAEAAELAGKCLLRGADAVYVALAKRLACPLVTLDHQQHSRAANVIQTLSPDELLSLLLA